MAAQSSRMKPVSSKTLDTLPALSLSVIIPTYKRIKDLERCLHALQLQTHPAQEVIVVARRDDGDTTHLVKSWQKLLPVKLMMVEIPGQVAALNAGLSAVSTDIACITDDDAAPRSNWLEKVHTHFLEKPYLGAVGGRDWIEQEQGPKSQQNIVGSVRWYGRIVGNHHLGCAGAREVDILKGVNMSFRMLAVVGLKFDPVLRGEGAQVHNDMAFSLAVKQRGWRLLYDPDVLVDHYPSKRHDINQRGKFNATTCANTSFNQYWTILSSMQPGLRQRLALIWQSIVGTRGEPGLLHAMRGGIRGDNLANTRWKCAREGRREARMEFRSRVLEKLRTTSQPRDNH